MGKDEYMKVSEELMETKDRLSKKLDAMLSGDVVYDTMIRHVQDTLGKIVANNDLLDIMMKYCPEGICSEWLLFLFAVMNTGPLPKELQTVEFQDGVERFSKEHGLDNQKES